MKSSDMLAPPLHKKIGGTCCRSLNSGVITSIPLSQSAGIDLISDFVINNSLVKEDRCINNLLCAQNQRHYSSLSSCWPP